LSGTRTVLSFQGGLLALKACQRLGLARPRLPGRKTLMLLDGVIGRERPGIGTVPNNRIAGWVEEAKRCASPGPTEHAMMEAAIQLDLITPEQAAALIERGKTLAKWLVEQDKSVAVEPRKAKQRIVDALGMLALLLFSLAVLVGFGWIALRVLKSL
jgi:hypothetical protein